MKKYCFKIADMYLHMDIEREHIASELFPFVTEDHRDDALPALFVSHKPTVDHKDPQSTPVVHNDYLHLYREDDLYILKYPGEPGIETVVFSPDKNDVTSGSADIYYPPSAAAGDISHGTLMALRLILSYFYQQQGKYMIHAASFIYRKKVWLVSAKSGTGKSTLVRHIKEVCPDEVSDYNGDLALISNWKKSDGSKSCAKIYGIPWNGTSGIFSTDDRELGGIFILHRADRTLPDQASVVLSDDTNTVYTMPDDERALSVMQRLISPSWDETQLLKNKCFSEDMIATIPLRHIDATNDISAGDLLHRAIDKLLSQ